MGLVPAAASGTCWSQGTCVIDRMAYCTSPHQTKTAGDKVFGEKARDSNKAGSKLEGWNLAAQQVGVLF